MSNRVVSALGILLLVLLGAAGWMVFGGYGGKSAQMRSIMRKHNHKEIEFYGRVVDQSGTALSGVQVNGSVISGMGNGAVSDPRTMTDASGYFEIKGVKGRTLDFNLFKPGYQFMPEGDAFDYTELVDEKARHHPDPKNPVILKMWKLQGAEPLAVRELAVKISPDGVPVHLDLMKGKQVAEGGDLIVTLHHEVWAPDQAGQRPFNWDIRFEAVEGGMIESTQRLMYLAPQDGYQPALVVEMPKEAKRWQTTIDRSLYLHSRGQIYSRVFFSFNANPDSGRGSYLVMNSWLNPKPGSRNLEFNPNKTVP